jgi:hypothetical protein
MSLITPHACAAGYLQPRGTPAWHPLWLLMLVRARQLALSSDDETSRGAARLRVGHDRRHSESLAGNDDDRVVTVTARPPK